MKIVNYVFEDEKSDEAIELAFNKKRADDRKKGCTVSEGKCLRC